MKAMKPVRILIAVLTALLALAATACASAAEIRPIPLDHDTLDLANGVFSFFVRGGDRVEKTGRFTAVLYKKDHYDGEQIRKLAPGDTVYANDRKWTVKSVQIHSARETPDVPDSYEVFTEEDLGEEEYLAFTPCEERRKPIGHDLSSDIIKKTVHTELILNKSHGKLCSIYRYTYLFFDVRYRTNMILMCMCGDYTVQMAY